MRAPDFIVIPALIGTEIVRRGFRGWRSSRFYNWRYSGAVPEGLAIAPVDIRPSSSAIGIAMYSGTYTFAGQTIQTNGTSPFLVEPPDKDWCETLHSFRWLRHISAGDSELARAHARAVIADWVEMYGHSYDHEVWQADITAARLIAWMAHAPTILARTDEADGKRFLKALTRQVRYLQLNLAHIRKGQPRMLAVIALAYASLCVTGREKIIRSAAKDLDRELVRQILPDGGHISRNPVVLLDLMADLVPLQELYVARGLDMPTQLPAALDRMSSALEFFRHSHGALAQFNGTGSTPDALLTAVLTRLGRRKQAPNSLPFSGYQRLASGKTVVIIDTGKPESRVTARQAMAGTLSFEMSHGSSCFVVNCGVPDGHCEKYAPFCRATAAHSTVTAGDKSSSRYASGGMFSSMLPSPLLRPPKTVEASRDNIDGHDHVCAWHDGYEPELGLRHRRDLYLSQDGSTLNGSDTFSPRGAHSVPVSVRFHLPPQISCSLLASGHTILLAAPDGNSWTITCVDAPISLEESIVFSGKGGPRKTQQVVITSDAAATPEIRWSFALREKAGRGERETASTPDLLDRLEAASVDR